jgi:succinyl-CoA:(S)-malate CoA-transferase subunit A
MPENDFILRDIRVLDLSQDIAGPFCTKLMAGLGAEVIKVEPPGTGDGTRRAGPFVHETPHAEQSAAFLYLNTGKKSITLDIQSQTGAFILQRLAQECAILVESFPAGYLDQLGLGYAALERLNPGLIYTSVTPFGQTGPYRRRSGFAHIAHAFGGLSYLAGFPGETPVLPGTTPLGDYMSSLYGAIGIMLALRHREKTGRGQVIDIGTYEAVFRQLDEIAVEKNLLFARLQPCLRIKHHDSIGDAIAGRRQRKRARSRHDRLLCHRPDRQVGPGPARSGAKCKLL